MMENEMLDVLKSLEADMLIEKSKKSGTKSIVTAANRIILFLDFMRLDIDLEFANIR